MKYIVRKANLSDLAKINKLEQDSFSPVWSEKLLSDAISDVNSTLFYVAVNEENMVVGFLIGMILYDEIHLAQIATQKEYRRCNLANMMIEKMFSDAKELNLKLSIIEVRVSNAPAINLYKKKGYKQIAIREKYYSDNKEDALIMQREL